MKYDTAGDPITGLKWTRKTTEKIAYELKAIGIKVSPNTVARLLKDMGFSLRVNQKKIASGGKLISKEEKEIRDCQFIYIRHLRETFAEKRCPVISVDTKKKELIGNFKNPGTSYTHDQEPVLTNDHDFRSYSIGIGIPYGIYDTLINHGVVYVGTTFDTPEFAVESIEKWWCNQGRSRYGNAKEILILADGGGSNSSHSRAWKYDIQHKLCNRYGISVTVCHYPPGTSKWNPIEHRLFSQISKNWAGIPLKSYETMINYIRTTKTSTGLQVNAFLLKKEYEKGVKISDSQMSNLLLEKHDTFPKWNYTIKPMKMGSYF